MEHVVVGASGQVGGHLLETLNGRGASVCGTYYRRGRTDLVPLDLEDESAVDTLVAETNPRVVWLPAALPDVDRCEREPELSHRMNVEVVTRLANKAQQIGAKFVFYSTDYVFDGHDGPYLESDSPHPLQVYGRHKLEAEEWLQEHVPDALIIRTAWVYSAEDNPRNFVYRIRQQLQSGQPVKAATDQISTPTAAEFLAAQSLAAVDENLRGILHLAGSKRISRYDWTVALAEEMGYSSDRVQPILTQDVGLAAARPLDGGLISHWAG